MTLTDENVFQDQLKGLLNQEGPLAKLRLKAWERFLELGLPTKAVESYQYLKLRKLFSKSLKTSFPGKVDPKPYLYPNCHSIVFVDGSYQAELSNLPKITVLSLKEAMGPFSALVQNHWSRFVKEEKDPFALINGALHSDGVLVYVPPKFKFEKPLEIVFISTQDTFQAPRVHLFFGRESQGDVIARHVGAPSFVNVSVDFTLDEGAKATYSQLGLGLKNEWLLDFTRASLKRDANFTANMVTTGSETSRFDYYVNLMGENGQAHLNGLWMLKGTDEAHIHVLMEHSAPHCESRQFYKGAITGSSRSSFEGKIFVRKEAQKTDSFQLNNNLILSDTAQAYSKPNLEIFADDVKASHGSTVGQLDEDELFYLRARGFSKPEAEALLTQAFLREVLEKMHVPEVQRDSIEAADQFLRF